MRERQSGKVWIRIISAVFRSVKEGQIQFRGATIRSPQQEEQTAARWETHNILYCCYTTRLCEQRAPKHYINLCLLSISFQNHRHWYAAITASIPLLSGFPPHLGTWPQGSAPIQPQEHYCGRCRTITRSSPSMLQFFPKAVDGVDGQSQTLSVSQVLLSANSESNNLMDLPPLRAPFKSL